MMIVYLLIAGVIAAFTILLSLLIDRIPYPKIRMVIPPVCGIVLAFWFVIQNPYREDQLPYMLIFLSPPLLLPFFILTPLPFVERKRGIVFDKLTLLYGSFMTTVLYFSVIHLGTQFFMPQLQAFSFVWIASSVLLSFLVFLGIFFVEASFSKADIEKSETSSGMPGGSKKLIILAVCLLAVFLLFFSFDNFQISEPCTGFQIGIIDQSRTTNSTIIHLTDEDLKRYPKLATPIMNSQKNAGNPYLKTHSNVTDLGNVEFSCNEESQMDRYRSFSEYYAGSGKNAYLEYNGTFYTTGPVWIH